MQLLRPRRKTEGGVSAAVVPAHPAITVNVVGLPLPGDIHVEQDHVRIRILFKLCDDRLRRTRPVNDVLIREQAQFPVRPHQTVVPGKSHAPLRKAVAADPVRFICVLPVFVPVTLIHHNRIRLKIHPLCQGLHLFVYGGNQKLQSHARPPFFPECL